VIKWRELVTTNKKTALSLSKVN